MITTIFYICLLLLIGKFFIFGIKAAWGITKLLVTVFLFPIILLGMVSIGLIELAFPILIIIGILSLFFD